MVAIASQCLQEDQPAILYSPARGVGQIFFPSDDDDHYNIFCIHQRAKYSSHEMMMMISVIYFESAKYSLTSHRMRMMWTIIVTSTDFDLTFL